MAEEDTLDFKDYDPLSHLSELRTKWNDEIPKEIIHSDSRILSKARRGWFTCVAVDVENALIDNEIVTPEGQEAARKLMDKYTSQEFIDKKLTSKEEIREFNELIDIILLKK